MRTVVAPLDAAVERQVARLEPRVADVARRYIARLAIDPYLGRPIPRGLLAQKRARAVLFDRDDHPERLFGDARGRVRRGDEDLSAGPRFRVIYRLLEARRVGVRVVQVLGVGPGHVGHGEEDDAYRQAARLLARVLNEERRTR